MTVLHLIFWHTIYSVLLCQAGHWLCVCNMGHMDYHINYVHSFDYVIQKVWFDIFWQLVPSVLLSCYGSCFQMSAISGDYTPCLYYSYLVWSASVNVALPFSTTVSWIHGTLSSHGTATVDLTGNNWDPFRVSLLLIALFGLAFNASYLFHIIVKGDWYSAQSWHQAYYSCVKQHCARAWYPWSHLCWSGI